MARYVITLSLAGSSTCAVSREVTRSADERAILFAQEWLHKSRLSTRILWQWYDAYLVEEVNKDGEKREVSRGVAEERECYRAGYRPAGRARGHTFGHAGTNRKYEVGRVKGKPADLRPDYLPIRRIGGSKAGRRHKELSPYQQKLRATVEAAKERLRANGNVPRMGSDTHNQEQNRDVGRL